MFDELEWPRGSFGADLFNLLQDTLNCRGVWSGVAMRLGKHSVLERPTDSRLGSKLTKYMFALIMIIPPFIANFKSF